MMKRYWIDAIAVIVISGAFIASYHIFGWGTVKVEKIVIKTVTKTVYVTKKTPENCDEYVKAFYDPWLITGATRGMWFDVTVQNQYKRADKSFEIECKLKPVKHELTGFLMGGLAFNLKTGLPELGFGGGVQYKYFIGNVGLTPGLAAIKFPSSLNILGMVGASYRW